MKLTSITDNKIIELCHKIFGEDINPTHINRNLKDDEISFFVSTLYDFGFDGDRYLIDEILLDKEDIYSPTDYPFDEHDSDTYKKWLVANHRHPLQDNNPFIHYATLDSIT